MNQIVTLRDNHSKLFGYIFWLFGFLGAHRFFYGRKKSGTLYFLTFGLLGVGWLIDLFLIPGMDDQTDITYRSGPIDYNIAWAMLTFLGVLGIHHFYMGKILWGIFYLLTGGLFGFGILYDFWTLNEQISERNTLMNLATS
ncbi:MAG: hypothetical protein CME63_13390 [Halobacteriovoraceae bacterium]|nr:hypothetical protein [Halobacteriovoraceae bacterium]MBC98736.1 hypothetical protein [Halobacteriovoraceae bacterium]|tara:strand:+ start:6566 stop:6988 length:423 start_codon:yes stop_codon:yes gene_type:complete